MRLMTVAVVLSCGLAQAGKKTVVVGAGDCKDGALLSAIKDFHDDARGVIRADLLDGDAVLRIVRPSAGRSLEDIARQVDTARSLLYGGQNEHGLELVSDALTELERVSSHAHPWPVTVNALILQAQMLRNLDRTRESAESFRRLLRVEPQYKLDPDSFPPSTLQALEVVRKELQRTKKGTAHVNSTPAGATVFVEGREVGKTPLKLDLPLGSYRVALVLGDGLSFPRKLNVGRDEVLQVDMAFEGGVGDQAPLCVNTTAEDGLALRLGSAVAAEQVIVLRNGAARGNPPYLRGSIYDSKGEKVRDGGVRREALHDLVTYLFTGKPVLDPSPPPEAPVHVAKVAEKTQEKHADVAEKKELPPPPPPPMVIAASRPVSGARVASFVALGLGAAAAASGAIYLSTAEPDRAALAQLREQNGGHLPEDPTTAFRLIDLVTANQAVSWGIIGVGVGTALMGVIGLAMFPGTVEVAVAPSPHGAALSVSGRF